MGLEGCQGCAGGLEQAYKNVLRSMNMTNRFIVVLIIVVFLIDKCVIILSQFLKIVYNQ